MGMKEQMREYPARTLREAEAIADKRGYNRGALKVYLQLAGYRNSGKAVSKLIGVHEQTALKRLATGNFTRNDMQKLKEVLDLTAEQFCAVFFNGEEPRERENE